MLQQINHGPLSLKTQVQDSDILKFATTTFNDHAYCAATPRNSNTPVKDFELVDDLREEGDDKPEAEKPTGKGKGKKKKGQAPGTRYTPQQSPIIFLIL